MISGSSAFFKSSLNIWKFLVHILLKPGLGNFEINLLACEMNAIVQQFEHSLSSQDEIYSIRNIVNNTVISVYRGRY